MAQEFTIKSPQIEDKINQLLPSQGGAGAGIDFSASTMVIPVVDLTETAEGSSLRQDLQVAFSHTSSNPFSIGFGATTTVVNTTGYYFIHGTTVALNNASSTVKHEINDGTTDKIVWNSTAWTGGGTGQTSYEFGYTFLLKAGDSFKITAETFALCVGSLRQVADINGNLVNP